MAGSEVSRAQSQRAFAKTMADVQLPGASRKALLDTFTLHPGDPEKLASRFLHILGPVEWKWPAFDNWAQEFRRRGTFPYMWGYLYLTTPLRAWPREPFDVVAWFSSATQMEGWLARRGYRPDPVPEDRRSLEEWIVEHVPGHELAVAGTEFYGHYLTGFIRLRREARAKLLVHTLQMTLYSLRDYSAARELGYPVEVMPGADCPVEVELAAKFNAGELEGLPPFFPGDRCCLSARVTQSPAEDSGSRERLQAIA